MSAVKQRWPVLYIPSRDGAEHSNLETLVLQIPGDDFLSRARLSRHWSLQEGT